MTKYLYIFLIIFTTQSSMAIETMTNSQSFDCSTFLDNIQLPAQCQLSFKPEDKDGHNVTLASQINIQKLMDTFHQTLSGQLNKRSCRERVNVKSSSLTIEANHLIVNARIWVEKRICEGFVRARVFEKTSSIKISLTPIVLQNEIRLKADVVKTGLSSFEERLIELIGKHPRELIEEKLDDTLRLKITDLSLPEALKQSMAFHSVSIDPDSNSIIVNLSAKLDVSTFLLLLNSWQQKL